MLHYSEFVSIIGVKNTLFGKISAEENPNTHPSYSEVCILTPIDASAFHSVLIFIVGISKSR